MFTISEIKLFKHIPFVFLTRHNTHFLSESYIACNEIIKTHSMRRDATQPENKSSCYLISNLAILFNFSLYHSTALTLNVVINYPQISRSPTSRPYVPTTCSHYRTHTHIRCTSPRYYTHTHTHEMEIQNFLKPEYIHNRPHKIFTKAAYTHAHPFTSYTHARRFSFIYPWISTYTHILLPRKGARQRARDFMRKRRARARSIDLPRDL